MKKKEVKSDHKKKQDSFRETRRLFQNKSSRRHLCHYFYFYVIRDHKEIEIETKYVERSVGSLPGFRLEMEKNEIAFTLLFPFFSISGQGSQRHKKASSVQVSFLKSTECLPISLTRESTTTGALYTLLLHKPCFYLQLLSLPLFASGNEFPLVTSHPSLLVLSMSARFGFTKESKKQSRAQCLSLVSFSFFFSFLIRVSFDFVTGAETRIRQRQRGVNLESKCIPGSMTVDLLYSWSHSLPSRFLTLCQLQSSSS